MEQLLLLLLHYLATVSIREVAILCRQFSLQVHVRLTPSFRLYFVRTTTTCRFSCFVCFQDRQSNSLLQCQICSFCACSRCDRLLNESDRPQPA